MAWKYNPFIGNLDYYQSGSGDVVGPSSATDNAIARYDGTTGKLIQNSLAIIQDGGAIQANGFIENRVVDELITIPSNYTMISANLEIDDGEIIIESDGELLIL